MYGNLSFFIEDSSSMSEEKVIKCDIREVKAWKETFF
jgi:hypothetical protein